ncbi:MAG: glutaredoxin family protein [Candidatus Acidiferrum sp.]|jgi:glutaredoxin
MSIHSEGERLAAHPLEVTVYSRPGCHLCEEAKTVLRPLLTEFDCALREVNIDLDTELAERYSWDIPVIFIGSHKAAKHRIDPVRFRRQLEEARAKAAATKPQNQANLD